MRYLITPLLAALLLLSMSAGADGHGGLANPNLIDDEGLAALPHVDEALADAIVAGRPYLNAQALDDVLAAIIETSTLI